MVAAVSNRVDAHCHLWALERGDYTWLDETNPALAPIARNFDWQDLAAARRPTDVNSFVVVQAAATHDETDYLLSLAKNHAEIDGVVGWLDLTTDQTRRLEEWVANPFFKGIRPMLQDIEETSWLAMHPKPENWRAMADLGLRLDALVEPRHLQMLAGFCEKHQDIPVVIDHAAKPKDALAGDQSAWTKWAIEIGSIGRQPNAYCKMSGLLTEMGKTDLRTAEKSLRPIMDVLLEAYGPERIMWGSDWPVLTLASGYQAWNEITLNLLEPLGQHAQKMILGDTARQFYGLADRK